MFEVKQCTAVGLVVFLGGALAAQEPVDATPPPSLLGAPLRKAAADNKRVLAVVAADAGLEQLLEDQGVARHLLYEFEIAKLDRDDLPRLAADHGVTAEGELPRLFAFDQAGVLLGTVEASELAKASPSDLVDRLRSWNATPIDAEALLAKTLADAAASDRRVLVHLGAPW